MTGDREMPSPKPAVVWYRGGCCRERLLRVFLTPAGWQILGDAYRVDPQTWGAIHDFDVESHFAGESHAPRLRKMDGFRADLPLIEADWPDWALYGAFWVGCDDQRTEASMALLAEDMANFKRGRGASSPVRRVLL